MTGRQSEIASGMDKQDRQDFSAHEIAALRWQ